MTPLGPSTVLYTVEPLHGGDAVQTPAGCPVYSGTSLWTPLGPSCCVTSGTSLIVGMHWDPDRTSYTSHSSWPVLYLQWIISIVVSWLSCIQWNLSIEDTTGTAGCPEWNLSIEDTIKLAVLYKVEPLYRGHHSAGCPVYSGTSLQWTPLGPSWLSCIQWNLSIEDTTGTQLAVLYTVEPLYRGHHWDPAGCPVYSGTSL